MDTAVMLKSMCHETLSVADIKAICKARGFAASLTPAHLEAVFLSGQGVGPAMGMLTPDEIILLHLLKFQDQAVEIDFFKNIYGGKESHHSYSSTFTERYKGVFKGVNESLVRRGLLLMALAEQPWGSKTKMERYRFRFPKEFEPYLPSPFAQAGMFEGEGEVKGAVLRPQFVSLLKSSAPPPLFSGWNYELELSGGQLLLGK